MEKPFVQWSKSLWHTWEVYKFLNLYTIKLSAWTERVREITKEKKRKSSSLFSVYIIFTTNYTLNISTRTLYMCVCMFTHIHTHTSKYIECSGIIYVCICTHMGMCVLYIFLHIILIIICITISGQGIYIPKPKLLLLFFGPLWV